MCTLTWSLNQLGYEIYFNRDEQRTRLKAIPPAFFHHQHSIMPIDPQANGTWIAVNAWGISLCLLNLYQKPFALNTNNNTKSNNKSKPVSRGLLIPQLIQQTTSHGIINLLKQMDLSVYPPFSLCIFPEKLSLKQAEVLFYQWDTKQLEYQNKPQAPIISSSVEFEKVVYERTQSYQNMINSDAYLSTNAHIDYHSSHTPEQDYRSVCMHRADAETQSLSVIKVAKKIDFLYANGSPCQSKLDHCLTLKLK